MSLMKSHQFVVPNIIVVTLSYGIFFSNIVDGEIYFGMKKYINGNMYKVFVNFSSYCTFTVSNKYFFVVLIYM